MQDNCVFCKIIEGIIPSTTVYEDDDFKVILDISPAAKGHCIILPRKHAADIFDLDDEIASKVLLVAKKIARGLMEELNCDGINILQNNKEAAGQTVFHYHMHVIPRYKKDQVNITWAQGKYEEKEAQTLANSIKARL